MPAPQDYPTRFPWYARIFIGLFLFDLVVRNCWNLGYFGEKYKNEVPDHVKALPTEKDRQDILATKNKESDGYFDRVGDAGYSLAHYLCPRDVFKWFAQRLNFFGRAITFDQDWPMFSPTVGKHETFPRAKFVYEDGSITEWRSPPEPLDPTSFHTTHLLWEKRLQVHGLLYDDHDVRMGFCNWVKKKWATNEKGSPIKTIKLYRVRYRKPDPHENVEEVYRTPPKVLPIFWTYDVATGDYQRIEEK